MACVSSTQWEIENCGGEGIVDAILDNQLEQLQAGLGIGWTVDITVGAEAGDSILVEIEVFDSEGNPLEEVKHLVMWLSDAAADVPTSTAPDGDVAISAKGVILIEHTADIYFEVLTDANGELDFDIGEAGAGTWYINFVQSDGSIASAEVTFA
jgi:hypothetical protein